MENGFGKYALWVELFQAEKKRAPLPHEIWESALDTAIVHIGNELVKLQRYGVSENCGYGKSEMSISKDKEGEFILFDKASELLKKEIKDSANFNINQQTHGGSCVSHSHANPQERTSPC